MNYCVSLKCFLLYETHSHHIIMRKNLFYRNVIIVTSRNEVFTHPETLLELTLEVHTVKGPVSISTLLRSAVSATVPTLKTTA